MLDPIAFARRSIAIGSLSFSLASKLLGSATRDHIMLLYAWCRFCDDAIDSLPAHLPLEDRLAAVTELKKRTLNAFAGCPDEHPVFQGLAILARRHDLPADYALELLAGMETDMRGSVMETEQDLDVYCYRVAGAVGLMFCHIAGISDIEAQKNACDLGMAMQMTNIARDVMEDRAMGRVYLPRTWLREAGISTDLRSENRADIAQVVQRLLAKAEQHYRSGEQGLVFLPLRSAFAVAAARYIYSAIGKKVLRKGERAWDARVVVTTPGKLWLLARGLIRTLSIIPGRLARPFQPIPIRRIWRIAP